ncbi:hypothetical protein ScalyP_jg11219 [Parmales sp. scaly parma]|nr:hypothetical protein ScalyP_jg11219 [Parmales sp. scaly parma]
MCRAIVCQTCLKTTWAGCGLHIAAALEGPYYSERFFDRQSVNPARNKNPYSFSEKFSASRAEITSPAQVRSERGQLYGEAKKTVKQYHVI